MKVTDKDVLYVAALANLELTITERERMVRDLNSILDYVDRLNRLDTSGVPPMAQVLERLGSSTAEQKGTTASSLREDKPYGLRPSLPQETTLENAPESDGTFFLVPKVIER